MAYIGKRFGAYDEAYDKIRRRRRPNLPDADPHALAIRLLRSMGFGAVCANEQEDHANSGRRISSTVFTSSAIGSVLSLWLIAGLRLWTAGLIVILVMLSSIPLSNLTALAHRLSFIALLACWLLNTAYATHAAQWQALSVSFAIPVAAPFAALWIGRVALLAVKVPLFVPAALAIVIAPLLTEDPWAFVATSQWRLVYLAAIALTPLLALVVRQLRHVDLVPIFDRARKVVERDEKATVLTASQILTNRIMWSAEHWPNPDRVRGYLRRSYQSHVLPGEVDDLRRLAAPSIRRRCVTRFLTLLAGTTMGTYLLNYVIITISLPASLAQKWSGVTTTAINLNFPILGHYRLLLWPYTGVAALFAIVAAVGFLAFTLTEEKYTDSLTDAIFAEPIEILIMIGAAYLFARKPAAQPVNPPSHNPVVVGQVEHRNRAERRALRNFKKSRKR